MLKFIIDNLEGLSDDIAALYEKDDTSGKYVLQVEGAVSKGRLDEFRDNNVELKKTIDTMTEKFKDMDPKRFSDLVELEKKHKDTKFIEAGQMEDLVVERTAERVTAMKEEYETKITELGGQVSTQGRQLESLLIDGAVREAATIGGIIPEAVEDVLLRAKTVFEITDGQVIPYETKNGERTKVYGKTGENVMTIPEWIKGLEKTSIHLFTPSSGGGAHNNGNRTNIDMKNATPAQKISAGLAAQ